MDSPISNSVTLHDPNHDPNSEILSFTDVCHHLRMSVVSVSIAVYIYSVIPSFLRTIQYVCIDIVSGSAILHVSVISSAVWNRFCHFTHVSMCIDIHHFCVPFNRTIQHVYHGLKYRHATRPEPWSHPSHPRHAFPMGLYPGGAVSAWGCIVVGVSAAWGKVGL